jgi:hypothetical protein
VAVLRIPALVAVLGNWAAYVDAQALTIERKGALHREASPSGHGTKAGSRSLTEAHEEQWVSICAVPSYYRSRAA